MYYQNVQDRTSRTWIETYERKNHRENHHLILKQIASMNGSSILSHVPSFSIIHSALNLPERFKQLSALNKRSSTDDDVADA